MVHGKSYTAGYIAGLKKAEEVARAYAEEQFKGGYAELHQRAFAGNSLAHNFKIKYEALEKQHER